LNVLNKKSKGPFYTEYLGNVGTFHTVFYKLFSFLYFSSLFLVHFTGNFNLKVGLHHFGDSSSNLNSSSSS
jgi:hypothetical protein